MQKMLYLCPVDWRWVKQRPQFLAETLGEYYDVHAVYPFRNNRKGLQKKSKAEVKLFPLFSLPTLNGRLAVAAKLNVFFTRLQLKLLIHIIHPDLLWLSMPWQFPLLPRKTKCTIIYDCMDDYAAITSRPAERNILIQQEKQLLSRADIVFASSEHLRKLLETRRESKEQTIWLLRNGCNGRWLSAQAEEETDSGDKQMVRIGYIGTIGRWFDFALLQKSLEADSRTEYHLYGPLENGITIPKHDRIIYHGVIEHNQLHHHAKKMHALMMPFVVNDIVQSVDPVKLYEYIWMNKPIITVYYPEIERFKEFVMFYRNEDEFLLHISQIRQNHQASYSKRQSAAFLKENNWNARAAQANNIIRKYC